MRPVGPTIPLVEVQGRWIAALLSGAMTLPDRTAQEREVERHRARQRETYLDSARYALEVDFRTCVRQMCADIRAGRAGI